MPESKKNKREHFAPGALTAPLPPVLVTVGDMESSNIITIAWTGILATIPPKTYISVRPTRHSYGILKERGEFVINLPSASLAREVDYAGIYTGAKVDKFEKCSFTKLESKEVSAPTIAECPIALECRVSDIMPMGSHDVFLADIVSVSCRDDVLLDGRICYDRADLLAYAHGEYFKLGENLGKFGFSTDKKSAEKSLASKEKSGKPKENAPSDKKENTKHSGVSETKKFSSEASKESASTFSEKKEKHNYAKLAKETPKKKKRTAKPFKKANKSSIKLK